LAKAAHQNGKEKQDNSCNIRQMISVPHFQVYVPVSVLSEDCLVYFSLADVTDGGRKTFAATHADTHRVQQRERGKKENRSTIDFFRSVFLYFLSSSCFELFDIPATTWFVQTSAPLGRWWPDDANRPLANRPRPRFQ